MYVYTFLICILYKNIQTIQLDLLSIFHLDESIFNFCLRIIFFIFTYETAHLHALNTNIDQNKYNVFISTSFYM